MKIGKLADKTICVVGLGYVGLPLAVEFGKKYRTIGFDINEERIRELEKGIDRTKELDRDELASARNLTYTGQPDDLKQANIYIITVPTPLDESKRPDLTALRSASKLVGSVLGPGDIVIYESTVYPGCTEEECIPVIEKESGLKFNEDFFCGYSPERINPGDKVHRLTTIKKVTSGSTRESAELIDDLYRSIITAGTFPVSSIKVAEAAKVIENSQRDINIAFINELALIFDKLNIDTTEVLEAAGTKWNFLKFSPGLVGGHCIGVDPYYLTYKAENAGYKPEIILAGRRINDNMGNYVASRVVKLMINRGQVVKDAGVLILGFTFKENCPDTRNTRVIDIVNELFEYGCHVDILDPWADRKDVRQEYSLDIVNSTEELNGSTYDAIILAVAHDEFKSLDMESLKNGNTVVYDVKSVLDKSQVVRL